MGSCAVVGSGVGCAGYGAVGGGCAAPAAAALISHSRDTLSEVTSGGWAGANCLCGGMQQHSNSTTRNDSTTAAMPQPAPTAKVLIKGAPPPVIPALIKKARTMGSFERVAIAPTPTLVPRKQQTRAAIRVYGPK